MIGWLKLFTDNTKEYGNDEAIEAGKASWSRGRLDDIQEVRLFNISRTGSLTVPDTMWHQFDRLIVPLVEGTHKPQRTHQVVQAKIYEHHIGMYLVCSCVGQRFFWAVVGDKIEEAFFTKEITKHHLDKWLTVILPAKDYPAMSFSPKGKMRHDNKQIFK
jgi:hypothetical protein